MDEMLENLRRHLDRCVVNEILKTPSYTVPIGVMGLDLADKTRNMRVIFNDPTTILIVGNKKYISKAHDEKFDEEKGLLMCLAKASGYTHANLKKLLANAQRQTKKK